MRTLRLLSIITLIGLSACDSMFPFGNGISKKNIIGEWRPVQYEVDGVTAEPTVEQREDFVRFNSDKTFVCQEKSEVVEGSWNFVPIGNVINVMPEEDPNNCIPWTVETATDNELVYSLTNANEQTVKIWLVK